MKDYTPQKYIDKIKEDLKHRNRFFVDNEFNALLDTVCKSYENTIAKDTILYRARIYSESDRFDKYHYPEFYKNQVYKGYDESQSFINLNTSAVPEGRANPSGIPYLYAAFDMETAIKEIKPYAETSINIAEIKLLDDLHIVDLCNNGGIANDAWGAEFLMLLCASFSTPIFDKGDYFLSQYISEYVKNKNFDGIAFLSAFTNFDDYYETNQGKNITIFNYKKCKATSSSLYLVNKVSIDYVSY